MAKLIKLKAWEKEIFIQNNFIFSCIFSSCIKLIDFFRCLFLKFIVFLSRLKKNVWNGSKKCTKCCWRYIKKLLPLETFKTKLKQILIMCLYYFWHLKRYICISWISFVIPSKWNVSGKSVSDAVFYCEKVILFHILFHKIQINFNCCTQFHIDVYLENYRLYMND